MRCPASHTQLEMRRMPKSWKMRSLARDAHCFRALPSFSGLRVMLELRSPSERNLGQSDALGASQFTSEKVRPMQKIVILASSLLLLTGAAVAQSQNPPANQGPGNPAINKSD